jgi:hypothetical protein
VELTQKDRHYLTELQHGGHDVLKRLKPERLPSPASLCIIACGDGVRRRETTAYIRAKTNCRCDHVIALPGGASLLARSSRLSSRPLRKLMLDAVAAAYRLQDTRTVLVTGHAPCGAAYEAGYGVQDIIQHIIEAKQIIRSYADANGMQLTPIGLLDVDYGDQKRTYKIRRESWLLHQTQFSKRDSSGFLDAMQA